MDYDRLEKGKGMRIDHENQAQDQTECGVSACNRWAREVLETSRRQFRAVPERDNQFQSPDTQTNTEVNHGLQI